MKRTRYDFVKNLYPKYIVLIIKKKKYYTYDDDDKILKYIKFKGNILRLDDRRINYLILDNLNIIKKREFDNNNYEKYKLLSGVNGILDTMVYKLVWESFDAHK